MITAEVITEYKDRMWIKIDRDNNDGAMYAILKDEIEPIMKACKEYLNK